MSLTRQETVEFTIPIPITVRACRCPDDSQDSFDYFIDSDDRDKVLAYCRKPGNETILYNLASQHYKQKKEISMSLTRQEVFQALADGKNIEFKGLAWGTGYDFITLFADGGDYSRLNEFEAYVWRIKPEPPKWYENIPEHGRLCWVYDSKKIKCIARICQYIPEKELSFIDDLPSPWKYATPLTDDEIKQFLTGEIE